MRLNRLIDMLMNKFESYLNTPFDVKFIRGLFSLGAMLIAAVLGYRFVGSANAEIKSEGFFLSLKAGVGPEMVVFYIGVFFVLVSTFLYWKYLSLKSPAQFGSALSIVLQRGLDNVTPYELQLAVLTDYKFHAYPPAILHIMSKAQPLSDLVDYRSGRSYLSFANGCFALLDVNKANSKALLNTILYFVYGFLVFCSFQAVLIFAVQKQWSETAISGISFFVFALLSWVSLNTYSAISAARRLVSSL